MTRYPHVLVADDSEADRTLLNIAFAELGREVTVAFEPSGELLLATLEAASPLADLIILDLKMPGLSGIAVLEKIRAEPTWCHIPVVILSNFASAALVKGTYAAGANSFLVKAATMEATTTMVRGMLDYWLGIVQLPELVA